MEQFDSDQRESDPYRDGNGKADGDRLSPLFGNEARRSQSDRNRIVARQDDIDRKDLQQRQHCIYAKGHDLPGSTADVGTGRAG